MTFTANPARAPDPIALIILTGFLGAGKTTRLNALLADPELVDTAVLINEIGDVGVDHYLVGAADTAVMLLDRGCLCCTMRGELVASLEDMLRARDNGRLPPFRRLILETSGTADPIPLLQSINTHPYLKLRYRPRGVVTLVDAVNGLATLDRFEEARRQVALADVIVLSMRDAIDPPRDITSLSLHLGELNPGADIITSTSALARLVAGGTFGSVERFAEALRRHPPKDGGPGHGEGLQTFVITSEVALSQSGFARLIDLLRSLHGPDLLRVKGFVRLSDDPRRPMLIQAVQQLFHPPVRLDSWPDADTDTRLVFVGHNLPPEAIEQLYTALADVSLAEPAGLPA